MLLSSAQVMSPTFLTDWFSRNTDIWNTHLAKFQGLPHQHFLEVGSWDGRSACWLLQNILTGEGSTLTCIDLFPMINREQIEQYSSDWNLPSPQPDSIDIEERFDENIRTIGATSRVIKRKGFSWDILGKLTAESYHCIYIDGSHRAHHALQDGVLSWPLLREGGILIFDDYELPALYGVGYPKPGIDAFLTIFGEFCTLLHRGFQVILRKESNANEPAGGHPATGAGAQLTTQRRITRPIFST